MVSWYEAAAYAAFVGKDLPTTYHWYKAAEMRQFSDILRFSNFEGQGTTEAGSHQGLSPYGNHDMAGNVREWCWNPTDSTPEGVTYSERHGTRFSIANRNVVREQNSSVHGYACSARPGL
ncbi:MAG: SUMF1/EgtB/PvdO family nonheme iron enzyme [Pyrinomonadaceae bacterium]